MNDKIKKDIEELDRIKKSCPRDCYLLYVVDFYFGADFFYIPKAIKRNKLKRNSKEWFLYHAGWLCEIPYDSPYLTAYRRTWRTRQGRLQAEMAESGQKGEKARKEKGK